MPSELPNEMKLEASRLKYFGLLLFCFLWTCGSVWMLKSGENQIAASGLIFLFGVLGLPISLWQIFRPGSLILNNEGFTQQMSGRTMACNWKDVSEFDVYRFRRQKLVSFSRKIDEGKIISGISKLLIGGHSGTLADTFGLDPEDLADIMNGFRTRALGQPS